MLLYISHKQTLEESCVIQQQGRSKTFPWKFLSSFRYRQDIHLSPKMRTDSSGGGEN